MSSSWKAAIMKLGLYDIVNYNDALVVAVRDTTLEIELLERMDIIYLTIGFAGIFMSISIVILIITEIICRIFKKISRKWTVAGIGMVVYAVFYIVKEIKGYVDFATAIGTITGIAASIVIPIVLLIIAKLKKPTKRVEENVA